MAISKKIHYCWFGGNPLPDLALKCIDSWKKYCPDYEIVRWDESNFPIDFCDYSKEAHQAKKWAFVSDVARLYALYNCGGIYMDTDVEVLKSLDEFLDNNAFSGFEKVDQVPTGIMASEKGNVMISEMLHDYDGSHFVKKDGTFDITTNVVRITNILIKHGLILNNVKQTVDGFTLYPKDYFCPKDAVSGELQLTDNSATIHHFNGSWAEWYDRRAGIRGRKLKKLFGAKIGGKINSVIYAFQRFGLFGCIKKIINRA